MIIYRIIHIGLYIEFCIFISRYILIYIKRFINREEYSDDAVVIEIKSRRRNSLPITQSMIDQIADPDLRDEQSKYVNTPELGAFTEEEAESMEEKVVAIVKEGKQLRDLNQAKTIKYITARDNAKEYIDNIREEDLSQIIKNYGNKSVFDVEKFIKLYDYYWDLRKKDGFGKSILFSFETCSYCIKTKFQISINLSPSSFLEPGGPPSIKGP